MNPLERLRYIARIDGEDPVAVALEATYVLADIAAADRAVLVTALRRLLDRHGHLGVMWVIAARIAGSLFPEEEAWAIVGELSSFWDKTDQVDHVFPSFVVGRTGRMSVFGTQDYLLDQTFDDEYAMEFLNAEPGATLIIESDLVSCNFAVVHSAATEVLKARKLVGVAEPVVVRAAFKSLVSSEIRESLKSRLADSGLHLDLDIVDLDKTFEINYQGDTFAPSVISKLVEWQAPQEILRAAGPLLG